MNKPTTIYIFKGCWIYYKSYKTITEAKYNQSILKQGGLKTKLEDVI